MMIMVQLRYRGGLASITGKKTEEINASSVAEVMSYIEDQYGKTAMKQAKRMLITVGGTNIQLLNRFKTSLSDGDIVSFLPLAAGG